MSKLEAPLRMASADSLAEFVERHPRLFVLTGAGCSTDSGIPDYRDAAGEWKRRPPIMFQEFVGGRTRAQALLGEESCRLPPHAVCAPERRADALATLERRGRIVQLVTQNVDGLHQAAGSRKRDRSARPHRYRALPGLRATELARAAAAGTRAAESGLRRLSTRSKRQTAMPISRMPRSRRSTCLPAMRVVDC